jgi:hypothetical protein
MHQYEPEPLKEAQDGGVEDPRHQKSTAHLPYQYRKQHL